MKNKEMKIKLSMKINTRWVGWNMDGKKYTDLYEKTLSVESTLYMGRYVKYRTVLDAQKITDNR
jgi:hypothetical protein